MGCKSSKATAAVQPVNNPGISNTLPHSDLAVFQSSAVSPLPQNNSDGDHVPNQNASNEGLENPEEGVNRSNKSKSRTRSFFRSNKARPIPRPAPQDLGLSTTEDTEPTYSGYRTGPILGVGGFTTVREVLSLQAQSPRSCRYPTPTTNDTLVAKIYPAHGHVGKGPAVPEMSNKRIFEQEVTILRKLDTTARRKKLLYSKAVIRYFDKLEVAGELHLICRPLCTGGELFSVIPNAQRSLSDRSWWLLTKQIIEAVQFIHYCGVTHRDVKPENFMFAKPWIDREAPPWLVLIDFGMAAEGRGPFSRLCGSTHYIAPEILKQPTYTNSIDWWAVGVMLYVLAFGKYPFNGNTLEGIGKAIRLEKPHFPKGVRTSTIESIIRGLLVKEPISRIMPGHIYWPRVESIIKRRGSASYVTSIQEQQSILPGVSPARSPTPKNRVKQQGRETMGASSESRRSNHLATKKKSLTRNVY